jgi:hypothetical protein
MECVRTCAEAERLPKRPAPAQAALVRESYRRRCHSVEPPPLLGFQAEPIADRHSYLLRLYIGFWRWAKKGVWERIFKHLSEDSDFEYVFIDATLVRVHQHGTGAKGGLKIRPSANRAAA